MIKYHKIDSVFLRDPDTKHRTFLLGEWTRDEFHYLADLEWVWTEKVDGTNIRIEVGTDGFRVGGRTDNAQIPSFLLPVLNEVGETAVKEALSGLVLFGEGYGPKIQSGGELYRTSPGFILFDVFTIDGLPLSRDNTEDIAQQIGADVVPIVGYGPLHAAIEMVRAGFDSLVSVSRQVAEGLVVRPAVELADRECRRVITKIKHRDFFECNY